MHSEADTELAAVDRAVRRAVEATESWHDAVRSQPVVAAIVNQAPLSRFRDVAGLQAFTELAAKSVISQNTEWQRGLLRWVSSLGVLRVTEDLHAEGERVAADEGAIVRLEQLERTSFRAAWKGLLRSRSYEEGSAWLSAAAERGEAVAAVRRERAAREEEAIHRFGFSSAEEMNGSPSRATLDAAALTFLGETRDIADSLRREGVRRGDAHAKTFVGAIRNSMARGAAEGWPAHLSLRSVVETLQAPADISRGLRVRAVVPVPYGAASFASALESFGSAYRRGAARASSLPFALANAPEFVDVHRFGFVFGSLPSTVTYQRRGLGLSTRVAQQQARMLAETALTHARKVALAALLVGQVVRPDRARFQGLVQDVFGEAVPITLAGAFPRATGGEHARLRALLSSNAFSEALRDRFDEDWFRNPETWRFLRIRASGPACAPEGEAEESFDPGGLARAFERALE